MCCFLEVGSSAGIAAGVDDGAGSATNVGFTADGLAKMEGSPYYFGRFGSVYGTTFYNLAGSGDYWSGSAVSSSGAFDLNYASVDLYPAHQGNRGNGWSIRCLAR